MSPYLESLITKAQANSSNGAEFDHSLGGRTASELLVAALLMQISQNPLSGGSGVVTCQYLQDLITKAQSSLADAGNFEHMLGGRNGVRLLVASLMTQLTAAAASVPDAPVGVSVSVITGALRLEWSAVSGATSYNIYRSLAGGGGTLYQSGVTDLFFEDSSVTSGQSYFYEVTAVNGVGESARSTEVEEIPQLPANVTGFSTSAIGGNSVDLVWDTVAGVDWYVEVQIAGGDWSSPISNTPSAVNNLTVTGLSPSTTYDFRIQAQNAFGLGAWVELLGVSTSMVAPEVTGVTPVADVSGDKHGKYFIKHDNAGSVSFTMDGGPINQQIQILFGFLSGADFVTGSEGKCFAIDAGIGLECYWFDTGTETQPAASYAAYNRVGINIGDGASDIANKFLVVAVSLGLSDIGSSGNTCLLENASGGVAADPDAVSSGTTVSVITDGRDSATSPGVADRNIMVPCPSNSTDVAIAYAIANEVNTDGAWFAWVDGSTCVITDLVSGARIDASDVDTGFTIAVLQDGGGPALIIDNDTLDLVFAWSPSRRIRTLYTGSLLRLRDSTTTTEGDVGYDGSNELDATARDAIIGAHDATAKVIYDQFIYGFNVSQATPAKQPALKVGGTVQTINGKQGILFDGASANVMQTASISHQIGTNDFCFSAIIKTDSSLAAWESILGFGAGGNPGFYINRGTKMGFFWGSDYLASATLSTSTTYVLTFVRQAGVYKFYINGVLDANTPSILFDNILDGVINLMSDTGFGDYGGGTLLEAIFWKRVPANLAAIMANQKSFAGI